MRKYQGVTCIAADSTCVCLLVTRVSAGVAAAGHLNRKRIKLRLLTKVVVLRPHQSQGAKRLCPLLIS
ncbi:hypothetical protein L2729_03780 [Shewanella gelidimarina]|uniref:hypothetical protein n=1 Tax=Shewanella gelidimarina TaxID=56813 RepID=UPI00200C4CC0|nr:hypothetical protein [Shewanella gelidimarina]MCL1057110.1 hypothetical protein [Shewanella gelidimarina]